MSSVFYLIIKRLYDITSTIVFLILVAPWLFLFIALAIKLDSKGPVFFMQKRSGLRNKKFYLFKFRTLVSGDHSVDKKGKYREVTIDSNIVTKVGRFLRKTGFDEFPQFINIFKGEMSVVGPRPHPVAMDRELKKSVPRYMERLSAKPGLTGWAQVNGQRGPANDPKIMAKRLKYDLWYVKNKSIFLDTKIILTTVLIGCKKIIGR